LLGRLFDTIGRKPLIVTTYAMSGCSCSASESSSRKEMLTAATQTLGWTIVFFFASAAASSAYLTVSEVFPIELRAMAIALFYAIGTGIGGLVAPALFGWLIQTGERREVFVGYALGAGLMLIAATVAGRLESPQRALARADCDAPLGRDEDER